MMTKRNNRCGKGNNELKKPTIAESTITIETMTTNIVETDTTIKSRLNKTSRIAAEQTKDVTLVQLKAKN